MSRFVIIAIVAAAVYVVMIVSLIQDADRPIGTHVFTAIERIGDADLRWSVVSLPGSGHPDGGVVEPRSST